MKGEGEGGGCRKPGGQEAGGRGRGGPSTLSRRTISACQAVSRQQSSALHTVTHTAVDLHPAPMLPCSGVTDFLYAVELGTVLDPNRLLIVDIDNFDSIPLVHISNRLHSVFCHVYVGLINCNS